MIPKIIHQTGPADKQKWHPLWHRCQKSWLTAFHDFEYKFWTDDDIDDLVRTEYKDYWELYSSFPIHIMKIDFVRLCILHKFGGIYADMDMFCYRNFYEELKEDIYLLENPLGNDPIENSMMCSVAGHPFWIECMELSKQRFDYAKKTRQDILENTKVISADKEYGLKLRPYFVFYITGTNHISAAFRMSKLRVLTLPGIFYNNNDISYHPEYRTKHVHTGLWGKESIEVFSENDQAKTFIRHLPIEDYDFYTDYSDGKYLTVNSFDWHKNDVDEQLPTNISYTFR